MCVAHIPIIVKALLLQVVGNESKYIARHSQSKIYVMHF